MELILERYYLDEHHTRGVLWVPEKGINFATLEPTDKMIAKHGNIAITEMFKSSGPIAIPRGEYFVDLHPSKKFGGIRPIVMNVPGFSDIFIHEGNWPRQTKGCILVGTTANANSIWFSKAAVNKLIEIIREAKQHLEPVKLSIVYRSEESIKNGNNRDNS